jgi:hypothetical protein
VAFLPFAHGLCTGRSFYFRDLAGQFLPFRRFAIEGLLRGEVRYWNPYAHEGLPLSLPPLGYPVDLLQLLFPDEHGLSLVLALHVPLAAVTLMILARSFGLSWLAAATGGLVYALGGFSLSSLNLYVYTQALAWAPLVVLTLMRAGEGGPRQVACAAMATALAVTTTGVEVVAQAVLAGLLLARPGRQTRRWLRVGASLLLGAGLSAVVVFTVRDGMPGSERASGFTSDVALAYSIHPISLLQTVIGDLHGELRDFTNNYWGMSFFPQGFPYFLSLYLGAGVLALTLTGLLQPSVPFRPLAALALLALLASLGRYVGLQALVEALPALRMFRYPVKAFFTVHLAAALFAAAGLHSLAGRESAQAWRRLAAVALPMGLVLVALPFLPALAPGGTRSLLTGFFPPDVSWAWRTSRTTAILHDASLGGGVAVGVGLVALAVVRRGLGATLGACLVTGLLAADLLRTGSGLNPMVTLSFFEPSEAMAPVLERLRREKARVFTCDPTSSPSFQAALHEAVRASQPHEALTFALLTEALVPFHNMSLGVPSVLSLDRTMLVPISRVFTPEESACQATPFLLRRIRDAGATHLLRLDPLDHPELRLQEVVAPRRIAPLRLHAYALEGALPRAEVVSRRISSGSSSGPAPQQGDSLALERGAPGPGRIVSLQESPGHAAIVLDADREAVVVLREAWAAGWSASVDGASRPVLRANGRHLAVLVPAGRSEVRLDYRPPRLWLGTGLTLVSALAAAGLLTRRTGAR